MMDLKALAAGVQQIAAEKNIPADKVMAALESSIAAAYKREYRKRSEVVKAKLDPKTGEAKFWQVKTVVDPSQVRIPTPEELEEAEKETRPERNEIQPEGEDVLPRYNPDRHIFIEEARKLKSNAEPGEELEFPLESHSDFGRIAAQTAKQVILQNLRDAERSSVREEFADKQGTIVSGIIQRFDRGNVYVEIGRATAVMLHFDTVPGEHYRPGDRMRFLISAVQDDPRRPSILLSRRHPNFVHKLFELEVPEIADGTVKIPALAREAGGRTKVAVASDVPGVDPVGSAVGQRGTRVMAVTNELGNEKIDIIEWSAEPEKFIANSLSPARVQAVEITGDKSARALVAEDQLSLAIGKGGQNVRLAVQLTGWNIDVRSVINPEAEQQDGSAAASQETEEKSEE